MNEVRNASMVGLERCKSCSYFTPRRQPVCANCGASTRESADDQPTVTPDQPEVTSPAPAAAATGADTPDGSDAGEPPNGGGGRGKVVAGAVAGAVILAAIAAGIVALSSRGGRQPEPPTPAPVTTVPAVESSTTVAPSTTARPSTTAAASTTAATDALACGRWQDLRYVAKNRPTERAAEITERAKGMEEAAATEKLRTAARNLAAAADNHDLNALAAAATAIDEICP